MKELLFIIFISSSSVVFAGWFDDIVNWTNSAVEDTGDWIGDATENTGKALRSATVDTGDVLNDGARWVGDTAKTVFKP